MQHVVGLLLLALSMTLGPSARAAIFGADDRQIVTPNIPGSALARSTAIAVLSGNLNENADGTIDLAVDAQSNLCANERFAKQPSLSYACTAFLVGPDLIATAGHCVYAVNNPGEELKDETEKACKSFHWLFDYQTDARGVTKTKGLSPTNLYRCKRIVYGIENAKAPFKDYALIQLDRPVAGRRPLSIATTEPSKGEILSMIGYPFGTPVTITRNGRVTLTDPARQSFVTSLDAFAGNSGGPVFNSKDEIVGLLIGGTPSWNTYEDRAAKCERYNRCREDGTGCSWTDKNTSIFPGFQKIGSDVQRIGPLRELLKLQ
ncbi:MAG: serine protease [Bdellovibrionota bacterium]